MKVKTPKQVLEYVRSQEGPYPQYRFKEIGDMLEQLMERCEALEGHDRECYYCHKPTNALAGNPGLWPIPMTHKEEPGRVKWHHSQCIWERMVDNMPKAHNFSGGILALAHSVVVEWANAGIEPDPRAQGMHHKLLNMSRYILTAFEMDRRNSCVDGHDWQPYSEHGKVIGERCSRFGCGITRGGTGGNQ